MECLCVCVCVCVCVNKRLLVDVTEMELSADGELRASDGCLLRRGAVAG